MAGSLILAGIPRIRVGVAAALGPPWNPIRLAEDLAVADQAALDDPRARRGAGLR